MERSKNRKKPVRTGNKRERGWILDWEKVESVARTQGHTVTTDLVAAVRAHEKKGDGLRSTIYKMRRGDGVDENSIRRLADTLGVTWESLVLRRASDDPDDPEGGELPSADRRGDGVEGPDDLTPPLLRPRLYLPAVALTALIAIFGLYVWVDREGSVAQPTVEPAIADDSDVRPPPVVGFLQPRGMGGLALTESLHVSLRSLWPVRETLTLRDASDVSSGDIEWNLQFVTRTEDRYLIAKLFASTADDRDLIWSDVFPVSAVTTRGNLIGKEVADSLVSHFGGTNLSNAPPDAALTAYARGLIELDRARTELMVRRIESTFSRALRLAPNWANAMAMICNVHIQDHYLTSSAESLDAADTQCNSALSLQESATAYLANGSLQRRLGNLERAEQNMLRALELAPSDPGALTGLAYLHLESYQRGKGQHFLDSALAYSEEALAIEPDYWKTPFTRAYIAFAVGDPRRSIDLYKRAAALNPDNSQIYMNLSAAEMCVDDYQGAKDTILAAQKHLRSDSLLLTNLGVANLDLGNLGGAVDQLRTAIDSQEHTGAVLYQLWGNYADALRRMGETDQAKQAYDRALEILDRVVTDGKQHPREKAARILYQALSVGLRLDQDAAFENQRLQAALEELWVNEAGKGPFFTAFVAQSWVALGQRERAEALIASIDTACPGFFKLPEPNTRA